jgi:hypothetical protein
MSKTREFFAQGTYNTINYNDKTGLYDILSSGSTTPLASTIRIFNSTNLTYDATNIGFFYISPDNKYIYLDGSNPNLDIVYLNYSIEKASSALTNTVLYDIQSGTSSSSQINGQTYGDIKLSLSTSQPIMTGLKKSICINFAYEQNSDIRANQLKLLANNTIYQSYNIYNCNSSTVGPTIQSPISGAPALSTGSLTGSGESSGESSGTNAINIGGSTLMCNSNNMDIKEYNIYYMYGLTFLNGLLIIISVALILLLVGGKK